MTKQKERTEYVELAALDREGLHVKMYFCGGWYHITHSNINTNGAVQFIRTREEAEDWFLWYVGYPEWLKASEDCFKQTRDKWKKEHRTLESVGAEDLTP